MACAALAGKTCTPGRQDLSLRERERRGNGLLLGQEIPLLLYEHGCAQAVALTATPLFFTHFLSAHLHLHCCPCLLCLSSSSMSGLIVGGPHLLLHMHAHTTPTTFCLLPPALLPPPSLGSDSLTIYLVNCCCAACLAALEWVVGRGIVKRKLSASFTPTPSPTPPWVVIISGQKTFLPHHMPACRHAYSREQKSGTHSPCLPCPAA